MSSAMSWDSKWRNSGTKTADWKDLILLIVLCFQAVFPSEITSDRALLPAFLRSWNQSAGSRMRAGRSSGFVMAFRSCVNQGFCRALCCEMPIKDLFARIYILKQLIIIQRLPPPFPKGGY